MWKPPKRSFLRLRVFSSEGQRKVKRIGTDSIAGVGGVFISCSRKNRKHIAAVQAQTLRKMS